MTASSPPTAEPELLLPDAADLRRVVAAALTEDLGPGCMTTLGAVDADAQVTAALVAREPGVLAGVPVARAVFAALAADARLGGRAVEVEPLVSEGGAFAAGDTLCRFRGFARAVLVGERTALNLVQRLSAIATLTRRYVDAVAGTGARILDTRKTTPGLRALEKYAVRAGGGTNHRMGLYDEAMLKDNHLAIEARRVGCEPHEVDLAALAGRIREQRPDARITIEADDLASVERALAAKPTVILLDNMGPERLREAIALVAARAGSSAHRPLLEASGGVSLETVRAIAETGVDRISVGALTHQAQNLDLGLDIALA